MDNSGNRRQVVFHAEKAPQTGLFKHMPLEENVEAELNTLELDIEHYKTIKNIGYGRFGSVVKVKRLSDQQIFAVKLINLQRETKYDAAHEMEVLKQLRHDRIVRYYGGFVDKDYTRILMEYCSGKNLETFIEANKRADKGGISEGLLWRYSAQLCEGLAYLHGKGIIHRDLKPANIFKDHVDDLKIGDFGLSKLLNGADETASVVGTANYTAPEVIITGIPEVENLYGRAIDMWSLGVIIFELATMKLPFPGSNDEKVSSSRIKGLIVSTEPVKLGEYTLQYTRYVGDMVDKLLQKDPSKRLTAAALQEDLVKVEPTVRQDLEAKKALCA